MRETEKQDLPRARDKEAGPVEALVAAALPAPVHTGHCRQLLCHLTQEHPVTLSGLKETEAQKCQGT